MVGTKIRLPQGSGGSSPPARTNMFTDSPSYAVPNGTFGLPQERFTPSKN